MEIATPQPYIDELDNTVDQQSLGGNVQLAPPNLLEVIPGHPYKNELQLATPAYSRSVSEGEELKSKIDDYTTVAYDWLTREGKAVEQRVGEAPLPAFPTNMLPSIPSQDLTKFGPKERRPLELDGVEYTVKALLGAMHPEDDKTTFIRELMPDGVTLTEAMILADKHPAYRDVIAAASYRVLDQMDVDGWLDNYSRVKFNSDSKTMHHIDPALKSGSNRDIVVAIVLDCFAGRFNLKQQRKDALAKGEDRPTPDGDADGGHHTGVATLVFSMLTSDHGYKRFFSEPYYDRPERLLRWIDGPIIRDELEQLELKKLYLPEHEYSDGIELIMYDGQPKTLSPEVTNVAILTGMEQHPVELTAATRLDSDGQEIKGFTTTNVREADAVKKYISQRASKLGVDFLSKRIDYPKGTIADEYSDAFNQLLIDLGYQQFTPEGSEARFGAKDSADIHLPGVQAYGATCTATISEGKFTLRDDSKGHFKFMYWGPNISKKKAEATALLMAPDVVRNRLIDTPTADEPRPTSTNNNSPRKAITATRRLFNLPRDIDRTKHK